MPGEAAPNGPPPISLEERTGFFQVIRAMKKAEVPFLVAGAFGVFHHTGFWRGTKDMDLLILPDHRERAIKVLCQAGLDDMFDQEWYDREWIFRSTRNGLIVDLIWRLANKVGDVDPGWFERGSSGHFFEVPVRYVSAADLCWMKLFVFQRLRCDWPDLLNVIRGTGGNLDWDHLLRQSGPHWRLLSGLVEIYDWLCPPERHFIPSHFRRALEERHLANGDEGTPCRPELFDWRPWLTGPKAGHSQGQE
jgi:hypothetical protein